MRATRARYRSFDGHAVMPVKALKGRKIVRNQGAQLTGEGLFDFGSAHLTKAGRHQIRALARSLAVARVVRCEGYADYGRSRSREFRLSRQRARAVCRALRHDGVKATMKPVGYGPRRVAVVGGSAAQRAANRRVVVLVTKIRKL